MNGRCQSDAHTRYRIGPLGEERVVIVIGCRSSRPDQPTTNPPSVMRGCIILQLCISIIALVLVVHPSSATIEKEFGSLTLCPPGGQSFLLAWSLACEMRRRKRDIISHDRVDNANVGYRPASLTEIQTICCKAGCELRDLLSYCDPFGPWNS